MMVFRADSSFICCAGWQGHSAAMPVHMQVHQAESAEHMLVFTLKHAVSRLPTNHITALRDALYRISRSSHSRAIGKTDKTASSPLMDAIDDFVAKLMFG